MAVLGFAGKAHLNGFYGLSRENKI